MKCEICHEADASQAIVREDDGQESELYVCAACARKERARRQKKSQRTRKGALDGRADVSITVGGFAPGDEPPPFIGAILEAVNGVVSEIAERGKSSARKASEDEPYVTYPCDAVPAAFRIRGRLHLEGLSLIGDLEAVQRALRALDCRLVGICRDSLRDSGRAFAFEYRGDPTCARRIVDALVEQERFARLHLIETFPRVLGDSICRSLALLKNCRLLAPTELFDLLSPIRIAAIHDLVDGITRRQVEDMMSRIDLDADAEAKADPDERDRIDAARADRINARFEDVILNERAEGKFL